MIVNSNFSWNVLTAVTQGDLSNTPANNSYTVDNKGKLLANNTQTEANNAQNVSQSKASSNSTNTIAANQSAA